MLSFLGRKIHLVDSGEVQVATRVMFAALRYFVEYRPVSWRGDLGLPGRIEPTRATVVKTQPGGRFCDSGLTIVVSASAVLSGPVPGIVSFVYSTPGQQARHRADRAGPDGSRGRGDWRSGAVRGPRAAEGVPPAPGRSRPRVA